MTPNENARRIVSTVVAVFGAAAGAGSAQQVLEIDHENGRDVINDDERAIAPYGLTIEHRRGELYLRDREEPDGIMVFSIETGEWVRTYHVPIGEGPREVRKRGPNFGPFSVTSDGGFYILGQVKVLHLDAHGDYESHWLPISPGFHTVCELGGQPAISIQRGLRRRSPSGQDETIGSRVVEGGYSWLSLPGSSRQEILAWQFARLACTEDVAFVVLPNQEEQRMTQGTTSWTSTFRSVGPDSLLVFSLDGEESALRVPTEFMDADGYKWNANLAPSINGHGNLVLASSDSDVPGAVMDPETGCYAVLRNRETQTYREFMGIYADSALIFHRDREEETRDGRRYVTLYSEARQISLHPLRRVSGEPCPGLLPSVR